MKMKQFTFLLIGVVLFLIPVQSRADQIDPRELALIMESTIADLDVCMIGLHHGPEDSNTLTYVSKIDESGWQGRLFGTYGQHEVDIYYTGTVTYIGGPNSQYDVNYTSEWYIDGETGTGAGTGVYKDPPFEFSIDLFNLEVSGSVSVTYGIATLTLSGSKNFTTHELNVSGSASVIDVPLIGSVAEGTVSFTYNQATGEYESEIEGRIIFWKTSTTINDGHIRVHDPCQPEPPPPEKRPNPILTPYPENSVPSPFPQGGGPTYGNMELSNTVVVQEAGDIPTVSEWGLIIMALLLLTAGAIMIIRQRRRVAV